MYSRLNQHLITNNILAMEQFGFRKNRSREHATYTLVNGILQAWNSKLQVAGIFCDLAKAFDSVNYDILIKKLKYYGVNEIGISWFKSYCTAENKELTLVLITFIITPLHGKELSEEFHRDWFWDHCFSLSI